jgi:hypothetical protein
LEKAASTTSFPKTARKSPVPKTPVLAHPCSFPNPNASPIPGYISLAEFRFSAIQNAGEGGKGRMTTDCLDHAISRFLHKRAQLASHAWLP